MNWQLREYASHRRAYTPSLWPPAVLSSVIIVLFDQIARPGVVALVAAAVGLAITTGWMRWAIWRRRHPVIPLDEYITDLINEQRRHSRWN